MGFPPLKSGNADRCSRGLGTWGRERASRVRHVGSCVLPNLRTGASVGNQDGHCPGQGDSSGTSPAVRPLASSRRAATRFVSVHRGPSPAPNPGLGPKQALPKGLPSSSTGKGCWLACWLPVVSSMKAGTGFLPHRNILQYPSQCQAHSRC